jgi:hypothetical protein
MRYKLLTSFARAQTILSRKIGQESMGSAICKLITEASIVRMQHLGDATFEIHRLAMFFL